MNTENKSCLFQAHGNGKLLLSGEYLVLKGAKAFAIPTKPGQSIKINKSQNNELSWTAYHPKGVWNTAKFNDTFTITETTDKRFAKKLQKILITALNMANLQIKDLLHIDIETHLEFMPEWGLGSSSSLIYLLSEYFKINPYQLLSHTFKGSGYDIASAQNKMPIFFLLDNNQAKNVAINFYPPFKENIYFIYLGKKMESGTAIASFKKTKVSKESISEISNISTLMAVCSDLSDFQNLMNKHEKIIGGIINETPVKTKHFSDFNGSIKSLGAWGGDFAMIATEKPFSYVKDYFLNKDLDIIFKYDELILKNPCH